MTRLTFVGFFLALALSFVCPGQKACAAVVDYHLVISRQEVNLAGQAAQGMTINGSIPGPTLRFREGDVARIRVENRMDVETSIHWHGILVPPGMDGVPEISFPAIRPGQTFTYQFPIRQSGTYWYHSHSHMQEQTGVYGALVIEPAHAGGHGHAAPPREAVVVLSDWTNQDPHGVLRALKRGSEWFTLEKGSGQSILGAIRLGMLGDYLTRELMRMPPMDISDVAYDAFLVNGKPQISLEAQPGELIKVRLVNGSASTYFHIQFAGGPLTIISADGQDVEPVQMDRLLVAVAETYDFVVKLPRSGKFELRASAHDGSGHASLWIGQGPSTPAPDIPRPNLYHAMGGISLAQALALTPAGAMGMPDRDVRAGRFDQPGMHMNDAGGHGQAHQPSMAGGHGQHSAMTLATDKSQGTEHGSDAAQHGTPSHGGHGPAAPDPESRHMETGGHGAVHAPDAAPGHMHGHGQPHQTPSVGGHGQHSAMPQAADKNQEPEPGAGVGGQQAPVHAGHGSVAPDPGSRHMETGGHGAVHAPDAAPGHMHGHAMTPHPTGEHAPAADQTAASGDESGAGGPAAGYVPKLGRNFGWLANDVSSSGPLAVDGGPERPWPPYASLRATHSTAPKSHAPLRQIRLTLDGDMERYVWLLNGKPLSERDDILIRRGEMVRMILINRTMMHHPMHLHGHFFRVINGQGDRSPLKHTVDVAPMSTTVIEFDADETGDWFFHCHLLYHMMSGMARMVHYDQYAPPPEVAAIRPRLYEDSWWFSGQADLLSNMSEGFLRLAGTRQEISAQWEAGWQRVGQTHWETLLTWSHHFNSFLWAFVGVDNLGQGWRLEKTRGVAGLGYMLPFNLETRWWVDSDGGFRARLERNFHLTPRLVLGGEAEYDTHTRWEGAVKISYTLTRDLSLIAKWHSEYAWGAGLELRF